MRLGKVDNQIITKVNVPVDSSIKLGYDDALKLAVMTTIAGYLEKDNIEVVTTEHKLKSSSSLNDFLSYMLNDKRAAPRIYRIRVKTTHKSSTTKASLPINDKGPTKIVSLSGGLDSVAGLLSLLEKGETVMPIWLGFGQKNEQQELQRAQNICKKLGIDLQTIYIDIGQYIDQEWERWKLGIIPGRNFLFASATSQLINKLNGGSIYICAHKEEITDTNTDKSNRFFTSSSAILSRLQGVNVRVETPFRDVTKPEIISYWVKHWIDKFNVMPEETLSCYFGYNCGECKACLNRAIAYAVANRPIESYKINPFKNTTGLLSGYIERFDDLVVERRVDLLFAMQQNIEHIPLELRHFLLSHDDEYREMVKERQRSVHEAKAMNRVVHG